MNTLWRQINSGARGQSCRRACALRAIAVGLWLMTGLVTSDCALADVTLRVTPEPVVSGESCQLQFEVSGGDYGDPDFTELEETFEIIGRNRQTSLTWVNGKRQQTATWVLSAIPRKTGSVTIPSVAFGAQRSIARTVQVVDRSPAAVGEAPDIMLEVETDTATPYVQQQVIYTVRLYHRVELSSPRFSSLKTSGDAEIKPLGKGRQFTHRIKGTTYEAFESRYAVFAQQSGPLTIEPLTLTTQIVARKRRFFDPFSQSLQTRRVRSRAIELDVKPVPAAFPADATWLPARNLRVYDEWEPDTRRADVGAPLSRTIYVWAEGLTDSQLPEVTLAAPDGLRVYPDQPQSNNQDTATGFTAVRQRKFAIIAQAAGDALFPELVLPWWNTVDDRLEYARLDGRELSFSGAGPAGADLATSGDPASDISAPAPASVPAPVAEDPRFWRWLAIAALIAWGATLAGWWYSRHRPTGTPRAARSTDPAPGADEARVSRDLKSACERHDAHAAASAVVAWASLAAPDRTAARATPTNLHNARVLATTPELGAEIRGLERALYGPAADSWQGTALWEAWRREPRLSSRRSKTADETLPRLFKLAQIN